jgi:hypothetical protein
MSPVFLARRILLAQALRSMFDFSSSPEVLDLKRQLKELNRATPAFVREVVRNGRPWEEQRDALYERVAQQTALERQIEDAKRGRGLAS